MRQKNADNFLRAANIGTAAVIMYPFLYFSMLFILQDFVTSGTLVWSVVWFFAALIFIIAEAWSIFFIFFRRNTDEFTKAMWNAGTTFAFFAAILWLMVGGWVENHFEALAAAEAYQASLVRASEAAANNDPSLIRPNDLWQVGPDVIRRFAVPIMLAAFFLGFNLKRFRG